MNQPQFIAGFSLALAIALAGEAQSASSLPVLLPIKCLEPDPQTGTSLAVIVRDLPLIHTAQLLPLNEQGAQVGKGDPTKQTDQVLTNLAGVLKAANSK